MEPLWPLGLRNREITRDGYDRFAVRCIGTGACSTTLTTAFVASRRPFILASLAFKFEFFQHTYRLDFGILGRLWAALIRTTAARITADLPRKCNRWNADLLALHHVAMMLYLFQADRNIANVFAIGALHVTRSMA